jgi:hypothetical protein
LDTSTQKSVIVINEKNLHNLQKTDAENVQKLREFQNNKPLESGEENLSE